MNLHKRSYTEELLDQDNIPFEDIKLNIRELNLVNKWLGGHKITLQGFEKILGNRTDISVCEIGCGGGDNLSAIVKWCNKKGITITCTGIDIKEECITFAAENKFLSPYTLWIVSDYRKVEFDNKPDIIFSSLFCHHFKEEELVAQVKWMKENSNTGFFINDLERNRIAYYSISVLTKFFSSSYLVKNDGPLSVARSLTKKEWGKILNNAGIINFRINWQWAFRYLISCIHE